MWTRFPFSSFIIKFSFAFFGLDDGGISSFLDNLINRDWVLMGQLIFVPTNILHGVSQASILLSRHPEMTSLRAEGLHTRPPSGRKQKRGRVQRTRFPFQLLFVYPSTVLTPVLLHHRNRWS